MALLKKSRIAYADTSQRFESRQQTAREAHSELRSAKDINSSKTTEKHKSSIKHSSSEEFDRITTTTNGNTDFVLATGRKRSRHSGRFLSNTRGQHDTKEDPATAASLARSSARIMYEEDSPCDMSENDDADDEDSPTTPAITSTDDYTSSRKRKRRTYMAVSCKRVAADPSDPFKLVAPTTQRLRTSLIVDIKDAWGDDHEDWLPSCAVLEQLRSAPRQRSRLIPAQDWDTRILKALKYLAHLTRHDTPAAHKAISRALYLAEYEGANDDLTPLALRHILYDACSNIKQMSLRSMPPARSLRSGKRKKITSSKSGCYGDCDPDDEEDMRHAANVRIKEEHEITYDSDDDNITVAAAANTSPDKASRVESVEGAAKATSDQSVDLQLWQRAIELAKAEEQKAEAQLALALARMEVIKLRNQGQPLSSHDGSA